LQERRVDVRVARDWIDPSRRWVLLPESAGAVRVLLIAESGTGKTVLLVDLVLCAAAMGWPVVMIDAKGDPADAELLASRVEAAGLSVAVSPKWDLFAGTAAQVTDKLMRLLPASDGANQHYLDEARLVLGIVQHSSPVRSVEDLRHRLTQPEKWVTDRADLAVLNAEVQKGQTARGLVWASLAGAVRPLEPYLSPTGWTYERLGGHVTIVPLSPVDAAQARLGDLMLTDLRRYMSDRLAVGDKRPMLVLVDEFPQLVTGASDPGENRRLPVRDRPLSRPRTCARRTVHRRPVRRRDEPPPRLVLRCRSGHWTVEGPRGRRQSRRHRHADGVRRRCRR
jgi:hypothetical protein